MHTVTYTYTSQNLIYSTCLLEYFNDKIFCIDLWVNLTDGTEMVVELTVTYSQIVHDYVSSCIHLLPLHEQATTYKQLAICCELRAAIYLCCSFSYCIFVIQRKQKAKTCLFIFYFIYFFCFRKKWLKLLDKWKPRSKSTHSYKIRYIWYILHTLTLKHNMKNLL